MAGIKMLPNVSLSAPKCMLIIWKVWIRNKAISPVPLHAYTHYDQTVMQLWEQNCFLVNYRHRVVASSPW